MEDLLKVAERLLEKEVLSKDDMVPTHTLTHTHTRARARQPHWIGYALTYLRSHLSVPVPSRNVARIRICCTKMILSTTPLVQKRRKSVKSRLQIQ